MRRKVLLFLSVIKLAARITLYMEFTEKMEYLKNTVLENKKSIYHCNCLENRVAMSK